jgi:NAD(P)-dependent dehydrogenase (short-subunit alcohol dehydrogenase family)
MKLERGQTAVVTGAGSGIGYALAERFAALGLNVVVADVDQAALDQAADKLRGAGAEVLAVRTDVSDEDAVQTLAQQTVERFGGANVVCNNAGVASRADAWFGPLSSWQWVFGVNLWGIIYGVRAFLPILLQGGGGHIVNTASMAGLIPGFGPSYDASKHAVVALTEDLYMTMSQAGLPIGVSVLCPGWVRTGIIDADRNWPAHLGEAPPPSFGSDVVTKYVRRAIDEGTTPAAVADTVVDAVESGRFWVFPNPEWVDFAVRHWHQIAELTNPAPADGIPGMPDPGEIAAEIQALLAPPAE